MSEYFVVMNSFAAPFCSDTSEKFVQAESLDECKRKVVEEYNHPAGLYAALIYMDANAYHKGSEPLARTCVISKAPSKEPRRISAGTPIVAMVPERSKSTASCTTWTTRRAVHGNARLSRRQLAR